MKLTVAPSVIKGNLHVQPSKSDAHRKMLCAALAEGISKIDNIVLSEDMEATIRGISAVGAEIEYEDSISFNGRKLLRINGSGGTAPKTVNVDCGESGSTLRFLSMIFAAAGCRTTLTGGGRLPLRSMEGLLELFGKTGIKYKIPGGGRYLPIEFDGVLGSGEYHIDSSVTSQFLTGLIIGLPAFEKSGTIYAEGEFESKGYVDVTIGVLEEFGVKIEGTNPYIVPENNGLRAVSTAVEGDWSNASYFYLMNALGADIGLFGLKKSSRQPDSVIEKHLRTIKDGRNTVIDISECPDIMPTLAVMAAASGGRTVFTGGRRLRAKESDRIASVAAGLENVGAGCTELEDGLVVTGGKIEGGEIDSFGDHRIAMAFASLCTVAEGDIIINGAECVKKSYPGFFDDLRSVGGIVL